MSTHTQRNHNGVAPLVRTSSFLGTIKTIVSAPLQWFASTDDFEASKGKRRRLPVASEGTHPGDDSLQSRTKRMRVSSPDRNTKPYLDPPTSAFKQPRRTPDQSSSGYHRHLSMSPRKILHIPIASTTSNQSPRNRHTVSPRPSGSHLRPEGISRTMSLDPPASNFTSCVQSSATIQDIREEPSSQRDAMSITRDASMSPVRPLRVRSSLTPQPSGATFGPVVAPRRERDPNEPPPLAALMSNPMFVKPPSGLQKSGAAEPVKQMTLGSLLDTQRRDRSPVRQSSILFGAGRRILDGSQSDSRATGHLWPVNAAEKALHELEVYKTPLLPTRLKGAATIPDIFLPKKSHPITLMNDDRDNKPRLGMKSKGKDKGKKKDGEAAIGLKPYAGEGGMKKWLARRRREEEQEKEKEKAEAMEDDGAEEERRKKEAERKAEELKLPPPPPPSIFEPGTARYSRETSSLRVGRIKRNHNHIERPVVRRHKKFSAAFEDEDDEMDGERAAEQKMLEEAGKKAPAFEIPVGFTFAKEATIIHDNSKAKEPPISALPFSFTKSTVPPHTATPPSEATVKPVASYVSVPLVPTISLEPPTPEPVKAPTTVTAPSATPAVTTSSGIPNFFASSSIFSKPAVVVPPPFTFSAAPSMPTHEPQKQPSESEQKLPVVDMPKISEASTSLGAISQPTTAPSTVQSPPATSAPPSTSLIGPLSAAAAPKPSLFGVPPTGTPAVNGPSLFGLPSPLTAAKETEKPTTSAPSLAPSVSFGESPKPAEPSVQPAVESKAAEPAKPDTSFSYGGPTAATASTAEASKSVFTFGQSATPPASAPTPTPETAPTPAAAEEPKTLFGGQTSTMPFSFGQRPGTAPAPEQPAPSPFSFASTPSKSSTAEKKPASTFSFGAPVAGPAPGPVSTPAFSFGGPPSGSNAADVSSKSFSFGQPTAARPATPPKVDQEVNMDESPSRDMNLNGNGKPPERPSLNFSFATPSTSGSALFAQSPATAASAPFSFGAAFQKEEKPESKPAVSFSAFGQPPSSSFSFGQKAPEGTALASSAAPFSFGQPSPNVAPPSPFTFGTSAPNPFAQPSTSTTSAPSSPSTFNRPTPAFAFGTPTVSQPSSTPFTFGTSSQPASPATNVTNLPSGSSSGTFTFGAGGGTAAPAASPFGAPAAPASGGGALFTIGAAPPLPDGARRIKGLPRRGGRR
ncbi:hypothetical protein F5I97DRAFT_1800445 [Phlebopus sp. FC_14]|nr:hypothetical protein F5I97DRAFT_1800445 [Phlebopus sp. FC_14]